jgi:hypothetical protein
MKTHDNNFLCSQVSGYMKFKDAVCEKFESMNSDFMKVLNK